MCWVRIISQPMNLRKTKKEIGQFGKGDHKEECGGTCVGFWTEQRIYLRGQGEKGKGMASGTGAPQQNGRVCTKTGINHRKHRR